MVDLRQAHVLESWKADSSRWASYALKGEHFAFVYFFFLTLSPYATAFGIGTGI